MSVESIDSNEDRLLEEDDVREVGTVDADVSVVEDEEGAGANPDEDDGDDGCCG